jgi:hypothetical protein
MIQLFVCRKCFQIFGCQKHNEEATQCVNCESFVKKWLPCKNYQIANSVGLDCICAYCLREKMKEEN